MKKKPKYLNTASGKKSRNSGKVTAVLGGIALALLFLVIVLMLVLPGEPEPIETMPVPTDPPVTTVPTEEPTVPGETEPVMLDNMAELYAQNPDVIGWIRIDDTKLDYPVMYTPDDEQKYIRADFEGNYDKSGLPFISADCSVVEPESTNLIVYGHNMRNGTAFRTLHSYAKEKFFEEHPTIYYSTLYEERTYEIFAVFYDEIYLKTDTCFKFYHFIDPETEEEFNEGIQYFQDKSLYDTGIEVEYGDDLLMLVTCSYHKDYGRLVVVARRVTEDSEVMDTATATELPEATQ